MSLTFKPAAKANRHAKVLLIGEAGVGKTHAMLTFPKPAVIDAEGSADWFTDRFGSFPVVTTKSYSDVVELLRQVRAGKVECDTLGIDALTTIYNGLVNAATEARMRGGSEDLRPLDWGRIKRKFSALLDELYHKLPVHVVCVGWIKAEYAKPGTQIEGRTVRDNDMIRIGEQFDGDKKTSHAFDFIFKIEGNDGTRTRATVIKSRSGALKAGQTIPDFSWKTIEPLLPHGDTEASGMSDEEQESKDASLFDSAPSGGTRPAPARQEQPARAPEPSKAQETRADEAPVPASFAAKLVGRVLEANLPPLWVEHIIAEVTGNPEAKDIADLQNMGQTREFMRLFAERKEEFETEISL